MPKHYTVVYTVNDDESFKEEWERIHENFMQSEGKPWAITAVSLDHEIDRLSLIEDALNANDLEAADKAIGFVNIGRIKSLDELKTA